MSGLRAKLVVGILPVLLPVLLPLLLGACGKSETIDTLKGFADDVCACKDAACVKDIEGKMLNYFEENARARGSEDDRQEVEKILQRYAECHAKHVPVAAPAAKVEAPKVNLKTPPSARANAPAPSQAETAEPTPKTDEGASLPADEPVKVAPRVEGAGATGDGPPPSKP